MAKFYLMLSILAVFGLSFLAKLEKGTYPVIFNFYILPIGVLAYMEGIVVGLAGAGICLLIFLFYVFFLNVEFASIFPAVVAAGITPLALAALRKAYGEDRLFLLEELKSSEKIIENLKHKNEKLNSSLRGLDEKISEIAGLYEITKNMSSSLLFDEIFQIFSEFLKKNFKFTVCKLILLNKDEKTVGKVYKIENTLNDSHSQMRLAKEELIDSEILKEVLEAKKIIYWEDFIAVPLKSQNKIMGALNIEGLEDEALEKFLIVSRQFSLEIEKVKLYEVVQELAVTDGLTGIFARRHFIEMLNEEFERSIKHHFKLSFLMIDLDHFKECNDRFGHMVGDVILREVAKALKQNIREIDLIGRYGGEEFSLLFPETDKVSAVLAAERLRVTVESRDFKVYDEILKMTISAGIATFPDDAKTITELIESSDKALYDAKASGRNIVVPFKGPCPAQGQGGNL